jgi:hypothetical protein
MLTDEQEADNYRLKQCYWKRNVKSTCYNTNEDHAVFINILLLCVIPLNNSSCIHKIISEHHYVIKGGNWPKILHLRISLFTLPGDAETVTVGLVTGKQDEWKNRCVNSGRPTEFLLLQNTHIVSKANPPSYIVGTWRFFLWGKTTGASNGTLLCLVLRLRSVLKLCTQWRSDANFHKAIFTF